MRLNTFDVEHQKYLISSFSSTNIVIFKFMKEDIQIETSTLFCTTKGLGMAYKGSENLKNK